MHLAIDPRTGGITAWDLTGKNTGDSGRVPTLLKQIDNPLTSVSADGAYDTEGVYKAIRDQKNGEQTKIIIPPKRHAQLSSNPVLKQRNGHIRSIERLGRRKWEKKSRYSKRSLVENAMYRYKTIIGSQMRARSLAGQRVEASLGCKILNVMAGLGMPESYRVE